jgi:heterodisulfide reductase subunit B2
MKYGLFLGCTIPVRGQNYEISARNVAKKFGMDLVDIDDFSCCGFPVKSTSTETAIIIAARNLAVASEKKLEICTLCNACTGVLTEANKHLSENKELRDKINEELKKYDKEFKKGVKIRHFDRILYEDIGSQKIKDSISKNLKMLRVSVHYGCHYLKPADIYDGFDDPENPKTLDELIKATGANLIDYKNKLDCCGGAILGVEENLALEMAKNKLDNIMAIKLEMAKHKLDNISAKKVDALITQCPFCTIMYEDNRRRIESKFNVNYQDMPVLYYPQLLGLAMGLDQNQLGFRLNKIKATPLLEKLGIN